jgi:hypothetical protein
MRVATTPSMPRGWKRVTLGAVGAVYIMGASFLAGVAAERVRADRERVAVMRAQAERQREARARAIRIEREHEASHAATRRR